MIDREKELRELINKQSEQITELSRATLRMHSLVILLVASTLAGIIVLLA